MITTTQRMDPQQNHRATGPRIAIVGGGAAGTIAAMSLLRRDWPAGCEVVLIERSGCFGPGVPYRTEDPDHLLNSIAARMSAVREDPDHFVRWLRRSRPGTRGDEYIQRGLYGRYLGDCLEEASREAAHRGLSLFKVTGEAVAVSREESGQVIVGLAHDAAPVRCDHVVIATGMLPGNDPVRIPPVLKHERRYVESGWQGLSRELLPADESPIVLIGTGLTMVDVALSIARSGYSGRMVATSRTGMLPRAQRPGYTTVRPVTVPTEGPVTAIEALGIFQAEVCRAVFDGGDWRDAMDSIGRVAPEVWRRMSLGERHWFVLNVGRTWDVHRFRIPPEAAKKLDALRSSGRLDVLAGGIASIEPSRRGALLEFDIPGRSGAAGRQSVEAGLVVNCSGSGRNIHATAPAIVSAGIEGGLLRADDMLLGLDVTTQGQAVDREGLPSQVLSVVGALRRGVEWEALNVPAIRRQAATIATRLQEDLTGATNSGRVV